MLQELLDNDEDFFRFGLRKSQEHQSQSEALTGDKLRQFEQSVTDSISRQAEIEAADEMTFEEFLDHYNAQLTSA